MQVTFTYVFCIVAQQLTFFNSKKQKKNHLLLYKNNSDTRIYSKQSAIVHLYTDGVFQLCLCYQFPFDEQKYCVCDFKLKNEH